MSEPRHERHSTDPGYEVQDVQTRQAVIFLIALTLGVSAVVAGVTVLEGLLVGVGPLKPVVADAPRVTPPPAPRLEVANGEVLDALRAREDVALNNYIWIDEAAGAVSLPIDRAIELTIERGLPIREGEGGELPRGITLPQGSSSGRTEENIP